VRRLCALAEIALVALATAPHVEAQATTVMLQGTISATDGSTPEGAQLEIRSLETNAARRVLTDRAGTYRVLGLTPGTYDVTVRAIGYGQQRREGVRLVLGHRATLNFMLDRGAVELEPTIVTADRALEIQRTDISTAVIQEEIEKLPLNTRNILNLAAIAPGIRTFASEGGRSLPNAGAQPGPRLVNLYVDGIEWKGTYNGTILGQPAIGSVIPQEAVREFRVFLNPYDVEYTRGASWVISAVTHRGGNSLEGSLFGFLQNEALIAKGAFQDEKPDFYRHQLGGNLRGPLIKDRLFFSASYEGQSTDNYFDVVPGRPTADPAYWDAYAGTFKAPQRAHSGLLRLTAPARSHTFDVIWATRHFTSESDYGRRLNGVMLSREGGLFTHVSLNSFLLRNTYSSSRLVNEISLQLLENNNDDFSLRPGPALRYPGIQIGRETQPLLIDSRHIRAINKTSYTFSGPGGQHVLKSGIEVSRLRVDTYRPSRRDGLFVFATDTSALPQRAEIAVGLNDPESTRDARDINRGWLVGAYLQDEWQPVPSITIAAGLRYDAELNTLNQKLITPWANDTTLQRVFGEEFLNTGDRENDLDNVAPRIAVTWDAFRTGRTFLRAGFGVLYDRVPIFGAQDESIARGWPTYVIQNPGTTDPAELRDSIARGGVTARPANIVLIKDRMDTPRNRQWSVGVGHELLDGLALNVDYLEQRLSNAHVTIRANQAVNGQRPITSRLGDIFIWDDFGDARFRALLASVTYDRGVSRMTVAYTLGWAETEFADFTTSDYPTADAYTMQRSEGDERHRMVVSGFTQVPFGLDVAAMAIVASPRPFLAFTGPQVTGTFNDDWPSGTRTHRRSGWDHWYRTVDVRLGKTFAVAQGRLTVTAEAFNVLNWANHAEYEGNASLGNYGEPVGDYARRQGQLGIRYQF
jgi:hypothetical protein